MQGVIINCRGQQHGFTLLEVMMAMVILGIGIMSIVALQARDTLYNNSARRQTQAYTWAMDRIERLRAVSYSSADLTVSATPHSVAQAPYTVRWTVADNTTNVPDTKKIDVSILWNNQTVSKITFTRTKDSL